MQLLPDGFLVAWDDPLRVPHVNISEWWRERQNHQVVDPARNVRGLSQAERLAFLKAGYARLRWLSGLPSSQNWTERMDQCGFTGALVAGAYGRKLEFANEDDLLNLLRVAAPVCYQASAVQGPLKLIREYVQNHAFTEPIANALRAYGNQLDGHTCGCCRDARFEIKLFLWLDEWIGIEPERCWGEWLRAQYRKLPQTERTAWRKFFARFRPRFPRHPGRAWLRRMQAGLNELGVTRFTRSAQRWLAPLAKPVAIEPLDSNLLRNFIWCCTLCPSPELDAALAPLAARSKSKQTEKLLEPIERYFLSRKGSIADSVLNQIHQHKASKPAPKTPAELAAEFRAKSERKLLAGIDPEGQRVRRAGGIFEIEGGLANYTFDPEARRITDRDSGVELEFDWSEAGAYLRTQIELSLRHKLWAAVVAALMREEAYRIRLRPKQVVIQ